MLLAIILGACEEQAPSISDAPPPELAQTAVASNQKEQTRWEEGPHADTYALEKGPNTYCAKCHAPTNWDPGATIDSPPNCVSCKFPFEASPRSAISNPLIAEEDWASVGCNVCHREQNGAIDPEMAWFDGATGYYETITSATELCEKCHLNNETLQHKRDLAGGAHAEFSCTECHDAHSTEASCTDCHQEVLIDPLVDHMQYSETHPNLTCVACHDASGLQAKPDPENRWVTFRTTELMGRISSKPYQSHIVQRSVNCRRCHYANNPWALDEVQELTIDEG